MDEPKQVEQQEKPVEFLIKEVGGGRHVVEARSGAAAQHLGWIRGRWSMEVADPRYVPSIKRMLEREGFRVEVEVPR